MKTMRSFRAREGFALPAALLAMIVIGAIVTGGFYVSSQEHDISLNTEHGAQALHVAQYGIENALATWTNSSIAGYTAPVTASLWNGSRQVGTYQITVMPLGQRLYALESEGRTVRGSQTAIRRVGSFVKTTSAAPQYTAAVTVVGALTREGNATITGTDQCLEEPTAPGVLARDQTLIQGITKGSQQNPEYMITGAPAVDQDETISLATLSQFGDIGLAELLQMATHYYQGNPATPKNMEPATTQGPGGEQICDASVNLNWGEPLPGSVCSNYYPIIHIDSDALIEVGRGQGILIVSGDLEVAGNLEFAGVVIVAGKLTMSGTGNKIAGTVIVQGDGDVGTSGTSGNATIQYDSCKIREAFENNLRLRPLASRSWFADTPPLPAGP
jgi:Tfp pilus assembly protein PilX